MSPKIFCTAALLSFIAPPVFAEDTAAEETNICEPRGTNGMVSLLLCPAGLEPAEWKAAGEAVCGDRKPCGAWIWEDAAKVPAEAPERHDLIPQENVLAAKAIWVNEAGELMVLEKQ